MPMSSERSFKVVGKSVTKVDALGLACGSPQFTDDIDLPHLAHAKILRSPHAHARIRSIDTRRAEELPGVLLVLTHRNTPRVMRTTAGQGYPEPSPYDFTTFDDKVRFVGDRVAAVLAETEEIATEALGLIEVEYEELPAVFDPERALEPGAPVIHDEPDARAVIPVPYEPGRNMAAHVQVAVGDVEQGFAEADLVFEGRFVSHYASHAMLEPPITICYFDGYGRLVIRTSTQVPFHVRRIVAQALQIPLRKIRVIKPRIGGGFGGKQEVMLEPVCALLAWRSRRPVRLAMTREEVFVAARTRHPQVVTLRMGARKDGELTALDMRAVMNSGAYGAHALTVACNTGSKTIPLLNKIPHLRFEATTAYTNLPVGGAYRGYGATQGYFALGVMVDEIACALGIDPVDFYARHHIREGETSPIFAALGEGTEGVVQTIESCGLPECLRRGAEAIGWREKRGWRQREGTRVRGLGMVCLMQGSSIPEIDMASATIKLNEDGSFNLLVGATDLGTGSDTVLAQLAAETLGVDVDAIIVHSSDTDLTPFDVGAYASSTTYLSGAAVQRAAEDARGAILRAAGEMLGEDPEKLELGEGGILDGEGRRLAELSEVALYTLYTRNQHQIVGTGSSISHKSPPPFAAHFVEVEVDEETGLVRVVHYVAAVDCGTAINPTLAEGQTEGAVVNGIGYALTERYLFDARGRLQNPDYGNYKIPCAADLPRITTILVPTYEPTGPCGAKSVSEISINGALPAISNAIFDAVGVRLRTAPFTPDRVLAALREARST
jgi:CO/xanthine dehydrogenase Mo-binding subunit